MPCRADSARSRLDFLVIAAAPTGCGAQHSKQLCQLQSLAAGRLRRVLRRHRRLLGRQTDRHGARQPLPFFWKGIALLVLFGFWFSAALTLNTAWSWSRPIERIEGVVSGKRVSKGRYSHSYMVKLATPKGPVETRVPKDVWAEIPEGRRFGLILCGGAEPGC